MVNNLPYPSQKVLKMFFDYLLGFLGPRLKISTLAGLLRTGIIGLGVADLDDDAGEKELLDFWTKDEITSDGFDAPLYGGGEEESRADGEIGLMTLRGGGRLALEGG